ncbi:MAG: hypothetical protein GWO07_11335 [Candidatus Dadabacteria bacterium]|nr:hypothetical protein [Candidatus Dadabacteria bacterium]NIS09332.1 hypothetical protein [Candidatus Dadabacteria bacterium]NIV42247.1 hypothetical protein [Candidatus Dadabacteria bacterium]NIY22578.1 hypothetical protein [Candidatus Dadabacteria bacterium]
MWHIILFLLCSICFADFSFAQNTIIAETVFRANRHNLHFPHISKDYTFVDLDSSYAIQKAYTEIKLRDDKISGYKTALTSKQAQGKYSALEPLSGVLFESGKTYSPSNIKLSDSRITLIETELGFLVDKDIIQTIELPIESQQSISNFISTVVPIIELPDIGFKELDGITAVDIISTNAGAKQFIVGRKNLIENTDINNNKIKLFRDGKLINSASSSEVMEGQISALIWLINDVISRGYEIKSGHILITGSVGKLSRATEGLYMGDFGKLGRIYFEIK